MREKHVVFIEASLTGAGQKAAEYAKNKGYYTTLCTKKPLSEYPNEFMDAINKVCICDTDSVSTMLTEICALDGARAIDGITTTADFYVPQAALAANVLHLPALSYGAALTARNKCIMRSILGKYHPELSVKFKAVFSVEEAVECAKSLGFPLVAKPFADNDGRGVMQISSVDELMQYTEPLVDELYHGSAPIHYLVNGILLEEFIDGDEYSVETLQSYRGDIQCIGVSRKDSFYGAEYRSFIETGGSFPIKTDASALLFTSVAKALQALQINCGVIHTECRIKDGKVKIIEINPRMVGDMMGSHVIEIATGINPADKVVEIALGANVDWKPLKNGGAALVGIPAKTSGIFQGIENIEELKKIPHVRHVCINKNLLGLQVDEPRANSDLVASIITDGKDADDARKNAMDAAYKCKILLK